MTLAPHIRVGAGLLTLGFLAIAVVLGTTSPVVASDPDPSTQTTGETHSARVVQIQIADQPVAWGTPIESPSWTHADAEATYVLTKASETIAANHSDAAHHLLGVRDPAGAVHVAESLATDRATDLRLLRISLAPNVLQVKPIRLPNPTKENRNAEANVPPSPTFPPPGTLITVSTPTRQYPPHLGILTGPARPIPSNAKLGIFFAQGTARPLIRSLQPGSGADAADLQRGDLILTVDGRNSPTPLAVIEAIQAKPRYAGDRIELTIKRQGQPQPLTRTVELGRTPPIPSTREQRLERSPHNPAPPSRRSSGFPLALPTDAPVPADQCGGPAFDLEDQFVGIVIARAGRTETLILPPGPLADALQRMAPKSK
ncbi:MAG: PDZ domain-containing protein [Planctomycetota bacterium]